MNNFQEQFPTLNRLIDGKKIIYFDNACSSLKPLPVIESMNNYYKNFGACGGLRSSHSLSLEVNDLCEKARKIAKEFINASDEREIVWTKNTTEGINLIANSLKLNENNNVVCSVADHHSLLLPFYKLLEEKRIGEMRIIEPDAEGIIDIEKWREKIDRNTGLVCVSHISNVTASTAPLKEIVQIAHENNALVLVDGAQSVPHVPIDAKELDLDFLVFSLHKMCGPTGMGVLYGKYDLLSNLNNFILGGEVIRDVEYRNNKITPTFLPPPSKFEAGIQNYGGIIGAGVAFEFLKSVGMKNIEECEKGLTKYFLEQMLKIGPVKILGPLEAEKRGSCLISFFIKNKVISPKDLSEFLNSEVDGYKIMTRAGGHCAHPLHYFFGINVAKGEGTVRASLYFYNTKEEIDIFVNSLNKFLKAVKI